MLSISNLSYFLGDRALYDEASLHIKPKDKIGLIGLNGTGKSTLLRLIVGEYLPDTGSISKAADCTLGFLNQDLLSYDTQESILNVAMEAFSEALQLQRDIDEILIKLETDYTDDLIDNLADLQGRFEVLDGYTIQSKAEAILEGLGFTTAELARPLKTFSGGWRMRVMLAKLLLQKPSLLLLDEPTNHLDLPSIQWLENYLSSYEGAVIIVSHDREFLDSCTNMIVEVTGAQLVPYAGNYSFYVEEKALRSEIQQAAFENQQSQIKQTEKFIERFKAKASKAKQVQSRVKSLDRLDMLEAVVEENAKVHFKFNFATEPGRKIVGLEKINKSYGDLHILKDTSAFIERGDKIALIGANGKGKSTLLRIIANSEPIDGLHELGHNVMTSFYAQHQLESLGLENTILEELKQAGSNKLEAELRTILGCFLFSSEDVFKKIKVLSGGEKSRVALAKMLISQSNFLLLDEPTNHLDMQSVNILTQALLQYKGSFAVVSHDRHFVEQIANKIWYIEDFQIKEYIGTYVEYRDWQKRIALENINAKNAKPAKVVENTTKKDTQAPKQVAKPIVNNSFKIKTIEDEIFSIETKINEVENKLADPETYKNQTLFSGLTSEHSNLKKSLDQKTKDWEKLLSE